MRAKATIASFINDVLINPFLAIFKKVKNSYLIIAARSVSVYAWWSICEKVEIKGKIASLFIISTMAIRMWWQIEMIFFSAFDLFMPNTLMALLCRMRLSFCVDGVKWARCWSIYRKILWSKPVLEYLILSR